MIIKLVNSLLIAYLLRITWWNNLFVYIGLPGEKGDRGLPGMYKNYQNYNKSVLPESNVKYVS